MENYALNVLLFITDVIHQLVCIQFYSNEITHICRWWVWLLYDHTVKYNSEDCKIRSEWEVEVYVCVGEVVRSGWLIGTRRLRRWDMIVSCLTLCAYLCETAKKNSNDGSWMIKKVWLGFWWGVVFGCMYCMCVMSRALLLQQCWSRLYPHFIFNTHTYSSDSGGKAVCCCCFFVASRPIRLSAV